VVIVVEVTDPLKPPDAVPLIVATPAVVPAVIVPTSIPIVELKPAWMTATAAAGVAGPATATFDDVRLMVMSLVAFVARFEASRRTAVIVLVAVPFALIVEGVAFRKT
jgi:hypothetical protein